MSAATNGKDGSSEGSSLTSGSNASKKSAHDRNPPELKRNEAAARAKPVQQVSDDSRHEDNDEENAAQQQPIEDEDDPCVKKKVEEVEVVKTFRRTPGLDPRYLPGTIQNFPSAIFRQKKPNPVLKRIEKSSRFQQQNQTLRCFVMYTDFYRCEKILGEGHEACTWFRDVFTSICPNDWVSRWDELRSQGRMPWSRFRTQGAFPGDRYGV